MSLTYFALAILGAFGVLGMVLFHDPVAAVLAKDPSAIVLLQGQPVLPIVAGENRND